MLDHKSYMDIQNMRAKLAFGFQKGDHVIIQEKIDGANASFQYDCETDSVACFSRNKVLTPENDLRGFYSWVGNLDKERVKSILGNNLRMFGEWLVPHTLHYPKEMQNTLYCYDVFDMETNLYLPQYRVKELVDQLGLNYVPVFYDGEFTTWETVMGYVGKTEMNTEVGEGIVLKNMTRLNGENTHKPFYLKIVHERFAETKGTPHKKPVEIEKIKERERLQALAETIVTEQRVKKMLYKLVDEGIIPENFTMQDMKIICRNLPTAVYHDCIKEEIYTVNQIPEFGKYSGAISIKLVKDIIRKKEENINHEEQDRK